jgi:hypothetical protein
VISARADHLPSRWIYPAGIVHPDAGSNLRRAHELNPRSAVGRRTQRREGPASPGQAVLWLERVAERHAEEGAIWRMTRVGRAESQRRRFQWYGSRASVTTRRSRRRPVSRPAGVASDRMPRSHLHARSKTSVVRATGRLPAATPGERAPRMRGNERSRSASDGFGWNAHGPSSVRHVSFIARNPLEAENRKGACKSSAPAGNCCANAQSSRAGRRVGMKRRSGIVRRPAAPDNASIASER